jgi:hypothetical protein
MTYLLLTLFFYNSKKIIFKINFKIILLDMKINLNKEKKANKEKQNLLVIGMSFS